MYGVTVESVFTKTNLIRNTANVKNDIVIRAPSADGKSMLP